jgi:hypothetical protein
MKKVVSIAFCAIVLCSLLSLAVGTALASEPGYSITEVYGGAAVTLDGKWGSGEWASDNSWIDNRFNVTNARFAYKMDSTATYMMSWLVEWHDTTTDANDRWIICIDGNADGGTAPQADDVKIEIVGHQSLTVSAGTGTGWGANSSTLASAVKWKDSLATSTYDAVTHWVLEVQADKGSLGAWGANPPPEGIYTAMYDASNPTQSAAWPSGTPVNVPNRWGVIATYDTTVPESLDLGVLVLLSSVAVMVGSFFVRKRSRLANSPVATMP